MGGEGPGFGAERTGVIGEVFSDEMPDRLSMHAPVLVNTLGHCAGTVVFAILLYYLLLDWR